MTMTTLDVAEPAWDWLVDAAIPSPFNSGKLVFYYIASMIVYCQQYCLLRHKGGDQGGCEGGNGLYRGHLAGGGVGNFE